MSLWEGLGLKGATGIRGEISSNLVYILPLEYGHSKQAPNGDIIRNHLGQYRGWVQEEVEAAWAKHAPDLGAAIHEGISLATLRILRAIADRTPVDTGRAKNAWIARLPDGSIEESGPKITARQQRAIKHTKTHRAKDREARRLSRWLKSRDIFNR